MPLKDSIFTVVIFFGFSLATLSMSTPPSELEIKTTLELDLSTKQDK